MIILVSTRDRAVDGTDGSPGRCSFGDSFGQVNLVGISLAVVPIVYELLLVDALHVNDRVGVGSAA
jgi:hypothetical protein